jgi:hypothetical protein
MNLTDILQIANAPSTPHFYFGSEQLDEWNAQHLYQGKAHAFSNWYVVIHTSNHGPDFRVLSCWRFGQCTPHCHDVPAS